MPSVPPTSSNDYQAPPAPAKLVLDRSVWNAVFGSVGARLRALEDVNSGIEALKLELQNFGIQRLDEAINPLIAETQAALAALQQTIAQAQAELSDTVDDANAAFAVALAAANASLSDLQDTLNQILSSGIPATSVVVSPIAGLTATQGQAAIAELLGKITTAQTGVNNLNTALSNAVTSLNSAIDLRAPKASPTFSGTVTLPDGTEISTTKPFGSTLSTFLKRSARTANAQLVKADQGYLIDITAGTFTQTFVAVATLGDGWWCYIRNSGTGTITLDPNGSETIDGAATLTLAAGDTRLVQCDGAALRTIAIDLAPREMLVVDERASGTSGGTATTGSWQPRPLNTVKLNSIPGASLASDQISLPAGTYVLSGNAAFLATGLTKVRVQNITDNTSLILGSSANTYTALYVAFVAGSFTLPSPKTIRFEYYCTSNNGGSGTALGEGYSFTSEVNTFAALSIRKIA